MDDEIRTEHPAFGKIRVAHVSGRANLFMVDYPHQHFITLRISTAMLQRNLAQDWVFADKEIVEVSLSEMQWARMISNPNTEGVPCTLNHYRDPATGKSLEPKMPEQHVGNQQTFSSEIDKKAKVAATKVKAALDKVNALMTGGAVKKTDLKAVQDLLYHANMDIAENMSFVVQQAEEAIETAVESAKGEIDSHIDYVMMKLGERALGDRLSAALEAGADIKAIGSALADAVTEPHKQITKP